MSEDGEITAGIIEDILCLGYGISCEEAIAIEQKLFRKLTNENAELRAEVEKLKRHWIEDDRDLDELIAKIDRYKELEKVVREFFEYEETGEIDGFLHWDEHWQKLKTVVANLDKEEQNEVHLPALRVCNRRSF
jgi:hypothetical protein